MNRNDINWPTFSFDESAYGVNCFEESSAHHHTTEAVLGNEAGWKSL